MRLKVELIVPIAIAVMFAPLQAQSTVDPSGTWKFQYGSGEQARVHRFVLSLGEDGRVTGTVHPPDGASWEIEEGKIDGNELQLTVRPEIRARTFVVELRGQIDGDEIRGDGTLIDSSSGVSRTIGWSPTRTVEMQDVVGSWNINIPDPRGTRTWNSVLTITGDGEQYQGTYTSGGQQRAVTNLGIESKRLTFTTVVTRAERELTLSFEGRPYGTRITNGTIDVNHGRFSLGFTATLSQEE